LQLTVDGAVLERLAVERNGPFSATFVTRALPTIRGQDSGLLVLRRRFVGNGMREDLVLQNLASESRTATIELEFDADFAHIFDVKDGRRSRWPRQQAEVVPGGLRYLGERSGALFELMIQVDESAYLRPGGVVFQVNVPAKGEWASSVLLLVGTDGAMAVPHFGTMTPVQRAAPVVRLQSWRRRALSITSDNRELVDVVETSLDDLGSLRMFDPQMPDRVTLVAGSPGSWPCSAETPS